MNIEILDALASCPLFSGISRDDIIDMMHTVRYRVVTYNKGDIIIMTGSPCMHADIIVDGEVVASMMGPSGRIIRISMHHSGNMLAPAFLFADDNRYPVEVEATTQTHVFRLKPEDMDLLIKSDPRIGRNYIHILSNIVAFLTKKVGMLSMNVKEKVKYFLMEERKRQQSDRILINISRQAMADHLGIQKYSLQRCFKEMQENGEITLEGKYIQILK